LSEQQAPPTAGRREWIGLAVIALPCLLYAMDLSVLNLALRIQLRFSNKLELSVHANKLHAVRAVLDRRYLKDSRGIIAIRNNHNNAPPAARRRFVEIVCGGYHRIEESRIAFRRRDRHQLTRGKLRRRQLLNHPRRFVDGKDGRSIFRLQNLLQKTRCCLLLKREARNHAARNVDQKSNIKRHLFGVADLSDFLWMSILFDPKVTGLQSQHWLTLRISN